jgi:hypothetical protein
LRGMHGPSFSQTSVFQNNFEAIQKGGNLQCVFTTPFFLPFHSLLHTSSQDNGS